MRFRILLWCVCLCAVHRAFALDDNPKKGDEPIDLKRSPPTPNSDIYDLSVEELLNVRVTSVAKREEKVRQADSAIYVISQEDIRRSGVTHVAEALRLAPGVHVAKANSNKWSITIRGFGGVFANKLLVLVDGRSVYNPLFSGVYWDVQDLMLEDIDRIEVIRGPGATLWGANAVNGVINIISKNSKDTQGGLVSATAGTETRGIGAARYGNTSLQKKLSWRIYTKYGDRDDSKVLRSDDDAKDDWRNVRGGFRADWLVDKANTVTVQGDIYDGNYESRVTLPTLEGPAFTETRTKDAHVSGGDLLARWSHKFSDSDLNLQAYYDNAVRDEVFIRQAINIGDIEADYHIELGRQDIVCGAEVRTISENLRDSFSIDFSPERSMRQVYSAFVQDDITVINDRLHVTVGSKFEHNEFSGVEIQPNVRFLWTPAKNHTVWASASRAVRTPNPAETDLTIRALTLPPSAPGGMANVLALLPNRHLHSEELLSYELGYRSQLHKTLSLDIAGFVNNYDELRTNEPLAPATETTPGPAHLLTGFQTQTKSYGETFGGEASMTWSPVHMWKLSANYSYLKIQLHTDDASNATDTESGERSNPVNIASVRSLLNLPHRVELDTSLYYVDNIPLAKISSYVRVDARVGWHATKSIDLSLSGQNLFDNKHQESGPSLFEKNTEVERDVLFKITWKF